ncbi:hypothetical protein GCM10010343_49310 [Streptomyces avidinii]|nr:hypothetical protein GCM10010343_49310 [Streptomyces avidinii]
MADEEVIELERTADAGAADAQHKERLGAAVLPRAEGKVVMGPLRRLPALRPVAAVCGLPERQVPGPQGPPAWGRSGQSPGRLSTPHRCP